MYKQDIYECDGCFKPLLAGYGYLIERGNYSGWIVDKECRDIIQNVCYDAKNK